VAELFSIVQFQSLPTLSSDIRLVFANVWLATPPRIFREDKMKRLLATTALLVLFAGCNMNENKEGRIRKLETQNEKITDRIELLENRLEEIESNH